MIYDALGYFTLLGADFSTDEQTLKQHYHEKAKFWHPDRNKSEDAIETFQKLSKAYDILKDKYLRMVYILLSLVYRQNNFPAMERLTIYKDANGNETPFLRVFAIWQIENGKVETKRLVGTYEDCLTFFKDTTIKNFKFGFFRPVFWRVLKHNLDQIQANPADNFQLLTHNAAAFYKGGKLENAYLSALQAMDYANSAQKAVLKAFIDRLPAMNVKMQKWNFNNLRAAQLAPFYKVAKRLSLILLIVLLIAGSYIFGPQKKQILNYYKLVRFNSGEEMADDTVALRVFNIPVNKEDDSMLYHITSEEKIMHGPSEKYDVLKISQKGQTVRLTGYTPDKSWSRIMLDNGEMGFIKGKYLQKGVENSIPSDSQIILH